MNTILAVVMAAAAGAPAGNLGATTPAGAWARYEQTFESPSGQSRLELTLARLSDDGGDVVVEVVAQRPEALGPTVLRVWLAPGVLGESDARQLWRHVRRVAVQSGGMPAQEVPVERVAMLLDQLAGNPDARLTGAGETRVGDTPCRRYTSAGSLALPGPEGDARRAEYAGELCLSDAVPFRRVRERVVTTFPGGQRTTGEWRLLAASREGASARLSGDVQPAPGAAR